MRAARSCGCIEVVSKPILVGYDPQAANQAPVRFGVAAARFTGAPLIVGAVGAHQAPELPVPDDIRAEFRALPGSSAARSLHEAAEQLDAGLLVVGSATQHHAVGDLLHGSVTDRLLHGATCPVAVVPADWESGGGVAVVGAAYTDTPEGHEALRGAVTLARGAGAKLRVLSAAEPEGFNQTFGGGAGVHALTFGEIGGTLRTAAERAAEEATAGLDDVDVDLDVSVQDPAEFLIAASQRVDLLVCGSRGYGPKKAVLLGGVTRRVTVEATCPVIVLARGEEATLEALIAPGTTAA
jgi:nucleotide-binding universal stress UspA family protein